MVTLRTHCEIISSYNRLVADVDLLNQLRIAPQSDNTLNSVCVAESHIVKIVCVGQYDWIHAGMIIRTWLVVWFLVRGPIILIW